MCYFRSMEWKRVHYSSVDCNCPEKAGSNCVKDSNGETRSIPETPFFLLIFTLPLSAKLLCTQNYNGNRLISVNSLILDLQVRMYLSTPAYHDRACIVCKRFRCVFSSVPLLSGLVTHKSFLTWCKMTPFVLSGSILQIATTQLLIVSSLQRQHTKGPFVSHNQCKTGKGF